MALPLEDEALQPKLERWRERWTKADGEAKKANLEAGKVKKEKQAKIKSEAERAGIPVAAFIKEMTLLDHVDKAKGVREDVIADDDTLKLEAFDRLTVLSKSALPLFDAATVKEMKKNAAKRPPPEDEEDTAEKSEKAGDDGKVVSLRGGEGDAASASA